MTVKISVAIITYNEEKNIARCIDSIRPVADEIVVIDSFSKDRTKQICEEKDVRFIENEFAGHIEQKNFAIAQTKYDHVLSLDADEFLSEELTKSIREIKKNWVSDAYSMNRLSSYGGKWIKHGQWYPDRKIRLWNKHIGVWGGENPHDKVILKRGVETTHLKGDLLHRAYRDSSEVIEKVQRYSDIFVRENVGKKNSSVLKIIGHSSFAFFKSFILKRGFLDGLEGLMVAMADGNHVFYKYAKLSVANHQASLGKNVIISRTDNLGDLILTLPLVGYLKSTIPDVKIFFIGKAYTKAIITQCEHIDEFLDREEVLKSPSILSSLNPDSILFVFPDKELAKAAKKLNIKQRVATAHRWFNWLYCNRLVNFSRIMSSLHESQLNFKLLKPFKLVSDMDIYDLPLYYGLKAREKNFDQLLNTDKFNLIIHPKSRGSAREWPLKNYYQLVESLPADQFKIFITGLKEEGEAMKRELPQFLKHDNVVDLTGKLTLEELISFVGQSDGLLACSTGALHIASALGKFSLGLYSPMRPIHPARWKPIGQKASYLVLDKECSDCRYKTECACIQSISVEEVKGRILEFTRQLNRVSKPDVV